jgi:hypothetical protein
VNLRGAMIAVAASLSPDIRRRNQMPQTLV